MSKDQFIEHLKEMGCTEEQIAEAVAKWEAIEAAQAAMEPAPPLPGDQWKSFEEIIRETVNRALEPLTKVDRRYMVFPGGPEPGDPDGLTKQQRLAKFLRAVYVGDSQNALTISQRALSEGDDSAGGYLVPEEFQRDVYDVIEQNRLMRQFATRVPMATDTMNLSSVVTKVTAYWTAEAASGTTSAPAWGRPVLYAKKLMGLTEPISSELQEDAVISLYDHIVNLFAEAMGKKEDYEGLRGDGTVFTGALNHADINNVGLGTGDTQFEDVDFTDMQAAIGELSNEKRAGARFTFHTDIVDHLMNLTDTNGAYLWTGVNAGAGPPANIRGFPWSTSDQMPGDADEDVSTPFILFGNLAWIAMGERSGMSITVLTEGTVDSVSLAQTDQVAVRIRERVAFAVLLGGCFARLTTAGS